MLSQRKLHKAKLTVSDFGIKTKTLQRTKSTEEG